ncbi:hypothetical protein QNI16_27660 [Cytophagaceae bacterium YF14B1]|uniref:Uncharacterized protein n=1 Tax=Xanthocytophaga flava TaxID=3048013 RepID=A0AAE3QS28_9BACT|nr:hypothetical protein [Xanthocytophaga flavus]MDJ1484305.1 hypothetical protein [Xanthocytophaga flavus]
MKQDIIKACLIAIFFISVILIFYSSGLETQSYNEERAYLEPYGDNRNIRKTRTVVVTENSNVGGYMTALGIIAGSSLLSLILVFINEQNIIDK